jgi:hypothetical protein
MQFDPSAAILASIARATTLTTLRVRPGQKARQRLVARRRRAARSIAPWHRRRRPRTTGAWIALPARSDLITLYASSRTGTEPDHET